MTGSTVTDRRTYDDVEPRLNFQEAQDKISKYFFGDTAGYDTGYGAPPPPAYNPGIGGVYYSTFDSDLRLVMKLGQGALIVFMILAIVAIVFLVMMTCLYCSSGFFGGRQSQQPDYRDYDYDTGSEPYTNGHSGGGEESQVKFATF